MLGKSLSIDSSLVIDFTVVLLCKSVAIVGIWNDSLSTACWVSTMLFMILSSLQLFPQIGKALFQFINAISPLFVPTDIFHAQSPSSQEKKSWWYKRSHVEWSFEEKVQNGTILDLPSARLQQLCCVSVGGHMGHRAEYEWGVVAFPKSSHFLCCGSSFPVKTGRAKIHFCENWREQLLDVLLQHEVNLSHTQKL